MKAVQQPAEQATAHVKIGRKYAIVIVGWTLLVGGSLYWNLHQLEQTTINTATAAARSSLAKDIGFRNWAASHGGVYVPPTERIPPNPYLHDPERDVVTTTGKHLTLMNPAYVLREVQRDFSGNVNIKSHLTSLKLSNPINAPDAWEASALKSFDRGSKEALAVSDIDGKPYLRLMLPLPVTPACLKCHDKQGYKLGENRGGIGASVLLEPYTEVQLVRGSHMSWSHGVIWLIGLLSTLAVYRREKHVTAEREAVQEMIRNLAYHDDLTHLPNRHLLKDRLQQAASISGRTGMSCALLFIDLDHFKTLNETRGYEAGDALLIEVAHRLSSSAREADTVARLGSDEFVVVLKTLDPLIAAATEQAQVVAEKVQALLSQPYQLKEHIHVLTPSIGIVVFKGEHANVENLLKFAEVAMHQAKAAGRNAIVFHDSDMQNVLESRAQMEIELRSALERQQFQLYYQVKVDSDERAIGAEALIRWIHPEHGVVSPAKFIPLAEETGLILPMGQWVLETACRQLRAWRELALTRDLTVSVNVSARQFRQPDFVAQVKAAIERNGVEPKLLKLEPTESMLFDNIDSVVATMSELKALGVQFSLDDFGTGYSSLQYLKRLPLDELKIDQSFVRNLATDSSDKAIVRTIIAMAQSLNLDVIAEGVETEQQRQILLSSGCIHYQGYLFGRPLPIEQFNALLHEKWGSGA
ncbi:MAG: EAL domain-containing protein [Sideroxydans sp.]